MMVEMVVDVFLVNDGDVVDDEKSIAAGIAYNF